MNQTTSLFSAENVTCGQMEGLKKPASKLSPISPEPWPPAGVKWYYSDASCAIACADCREILPELEKVDLVLTDPPYSEHVHAKHWVGASAVNDGFRASFCRNKALGFEALDDETRLFVAKECARLISRWFLAFCNVEMVSEWARDLGIAQLEYVRTCSWVKLNAAPQFTGDRPAPGFECIVCAHPSGRKRWNGGGRQGVFTHPIELNRGGKNGRLHTAQKPLSLMVELVALFSEPGESILDPFMGSGTTLRAAKDLGRRAIGIEIEEKYCEIGAKRLAQEVFAL